MTAADRAAVRAFWEVYETHYDEVYAALLHALSAHSELGPLFRTLPEHQRMAQSQASRETLRRAAVDGDWGPHLNNLREQGAGYARAGISFSAWFDAVGAFRDQLLPYVLRSRSNATDGSLPSLTGMSKYVDFAMATIGEAYLQTKEEIIRQQEEAIRELSTPVLRVHDRLLILPIIGVIDTHRARQFTEELLRAIRENRAKVAVIDITGVPTVDSKVANHLVQTVEAARLMGTTAIVTGLSAEIAQTLVTLGIDLSKMNTVGDLQGGIEEANRLLGYRVVPSEPATP